MAAPHADETFFRDLELRRTRALVERDLNVIAELHALDYELVTPAGRTLTREQYLAAIEHEAFYTGWDVGDMRCRLSPELAVIRYRATLRFPSGRELVCWHTDAYQRREGRWQAVWSQATEIAAGATRGPVGLHGLLRDPTRPPMSLEAMNEAIASHVAEDDQRIAGGCEPIR